MKWSNLKKNKCAQCGKDLSLAYNAEKKMFECKCGFKITEQRFSEIVADRVKSDIEHAQEAVDGIYNQMQDNIELSSHKPFLT